MGLVWSDEQRTRVPVIDLRSLADPVIDIRDHAGSGADPRPGGVVLRWALCGARCTVHVSWGRADPAAVTHERDVRSTP